MQSIKTRNNGDALGTGRRKSAVARVRVRLGSGKITINKRPLDEYFVLEQHRQAVLKPLQAVDRSNSFDVVIRVSGGGVTGQADACKMGLARALVSYDVECYTQMREGGLLTRDSRMVERKKYGLHKARKGTQFSKR